jgi:NADH:ubiquinone oxidoreductase subunit 3 (subunit A)
MTIIKDILIFYAIKESSGNYEYLMLMLIIFDMIVLVTLPLAIKMMGGVC